MELRAPRNLSVSVKSMWDWLGVQVELPAWPDLTPYLKTNERSSKAYEMMQWAKAAPSLPTWVKSPDPTWWRVTASSRPPTIWRLPCTHKYILKIKKKIKRTRGSSFQTQGSLHSPFLSSVGSRSKTSLCHPVFPVACISTEMPRFSLSALSDYLQAYEMYLLTTRNFLAPPPSECSFSVLPPFLPPFLLPFFPFNNTKHLWICLHYPIHP